jgi:DNA-binding CsgD family transcriptional regulator
MGQLYSLCCSVPLSRIEETLVSILLESPMTDPNPQPTGRPDSLDSLDSDETGEHENPLARCRPSSYAPFESQRLDSARHIEGCRPMPVKSCPLSTDEILASAAHALRSPLSRVKGFVTTLLRTDIDWDDETRTEFIAEIDRDADRLAELVESLCAPRTTCERGLAGRGPRGQETGPAHSAVTVNTQVSVLALFNMLEAALVVGAARADTIRYLLDETNQQESWQAIKAALAGRMQFSADPAARLAREMLTDRPEQLTERELDVLRLVARGCSNKQIARDLRITLNTVKTHVSNIIGKLGVESRTQAALHAGHIGLIPLYEQPVTGNLVA